jgi:hypothetical protein
VSNATISNNYFAYNFSNAMQISNSKYINVTGNYSLDSGWDIEDTSPLPAGYDIETWSNNTFACDSTGEGFFMVNLPWQAAVGGNCSWGDSGCSGAGSPCTIGQYSNVTIENNTITGPGAVLDILPSQGATVINNSFTNGGVLH